jgi:hypothetical protein
MSTSHLSASQRTILALQHRVAELEHMQREYNAFLNYVITYHGEQIKPEEKVFIVYTRNMRLLDFLPVRSDIVDDGARMELRLIHPKPNPIITLPS